MRMSEVMVTEYVCRGKESQKNSIHGLCLPQEGNRKYLIRKVGWGLSMNWETFGIAAFGMGEKPTRERIRVNGICQKFSYQAENLFFFFWSLFLFVILFGYAGSQFWYVTSSVFTVAGRIFSCGIQFPDQGLAMTPGSGTESNMQKSSHEYSLNS